VVLRVDGSRVTLISALVPIAARADWAEYRLFWQEAKGRPLNAVLYSGEGQIYRVPDAPPRLDIAITVLSGVGGEPVDSGNLSLELQRDGRLSGTRWLNSAQRDVPAMLQRR